MPATATGLGLKPLEDMAGSAAQLERGFGGDRLDVRRPADAVGAKDPFAGRHRLGGLEGMITCTSSGRMRTWVTPGGVDTSIRLRRL